MTNSPPGRSFESQLLVVLSRWRMFEFDFLTDIVKMLRQIKVNPATEISEYQLSTVTYGTAPAPFLTLRVLLQLAKDEELRFPLGAQAIHQNSYVDDVFAGADSLQQASVVCGMKSQASLPLANFL